MPVEDSDAHLDWTASARSFRRLTGEPGVGKTWLLDVAADIALAAGTWVLRATARLSIHSLAVPL